MLLLWSMEGSGRGGMSPGVKEPGTAGTDHVVVKEEALVDEEVEVKTEPPCEDGAGGASETTERAGAACGLDVRDAPEPGPVRVQAPRVVTEETELLSEEDQPSEYKAGSSGVSAAAVLAGLYTGHAVKDELALGPEEIHRPDIAGAIPASSREVSEATAAPARARGGALRECSVRLQRVALPEAPRASPESPRTPREDTRPNANRQSDAEEEIHGADCEKGLMCHLCGRRFTLKSNLMKHVMIHIHMPTGKEQEGSRSNAANYDAPVVSQCGPRVLFRECSVRLERVPTPRGEPAAAARAPASAPHAAPPRGGHGDGQYAVKNTYQCDTCGKIYQLKHRLISHIKIYGHLNKNQHIDMVKRPHLCEICKKRFILLCNLKAHKVIHSNEKPYSCNTCHKKFNFFAYLKIHNRIHSGEKPYGCEICKKRFTTTGHLKTHTRVHTGEKPYSCETCKKKFSESNKLKSHKRVHTGEMPYSCKTCKKAFRFSSSLKSHERCHTGEKPYSCIICKKQFAHPNALKHHKLIHTGEKPFSCDICKKEFAQLAHLNIHKLTHSDQTYSCKICNNKFKQLRYLKIHERIHAGEKRYSCDTCNKKFTQLAHLTTHKRIHTGEKPYTCDICDKSFTDSGNLNKHKRLHTGIKPYSCKICKKQFSHPSNLSNHVKIHNK